MSILKQKIVSTGLVLFAAFFGFQILAYIINLNQSVEFFRASIYLFVFLWLMIFFLFDLHFKNPGAFKRAKARHESVVYWLNRSIKIWLSAFKDRVSHLMAFGEVKHALNYLVLPALLFWATAGAIFLNLGQVQVQQFYILTSSLAIGLNFWFIKEVFTRKKEIVDQDIFVMLSLVKVFTAALAYGVMMAMMRYYCLSTGLFFSGMFVLTYLLLHQALFQHRMLRQKNMAHILVISLAMSALGAVVYMNWGFNYFTAAIFLGAFYNFFWGVYHYYLDQSLTKKAFWEIFAICALIAYLVFINTNFQARLLNGCF